MSAAGSPSLLDPAFQARLRGLEIALRRALPSSRRGDRRAPQRKGISLEYADFRSYVPGDDVRHLDWSGYARLDQLFIRLYHDEEDVQVHLLVDDSRSMGFGEPTKGLLARQLAAALAFIGLGAGCRVGAARLGDEIRALPPASGPAALAPILALLDEDGAEGSRPLAQTCERFAAEHRPRGVVILLSDLLEPAGPDAVLRAFASPQIETDVVQVLARDDVEPAFDGDLRLVDAETGRRVEASMLPRVLERYRETARAFIALWAETCRRRGVAFVQVTSDQSLEDVVLRALVQQGVVR